MSDLIKASHSAVMALYKGGYVDKDMPLEQVVRMVKMQEALRLLELIMLQEAHPADIEELNKLLDAKSDVIAFIAANR